MLQRTIRHAIAVVLLLGLSTAPVRADSTDELKSWIDEHLDSLVSLYKHFHTHPELSLQEKETAARFAKELRETGIDVIERVGGHGVVGVLKNGDGPTVMLRTDLDALPVAEETGLPYASTVKTKNRDGTEVGVMHACGHDIHITNLIGVARYLAGHKDQWSGTVIFLGQPAEEIGAGASAMLKDKLYERFPKPQYALALHVDANLAAGSVGYRAGYAMANTDSVDITLRGRGGHGSAPQTTIDPIVMAAQLVLDLQTIVSREINPLEPAVVTVGSIHGGTKSNIIPDDCRLQLTIRSYDEKIRKHLHEAIKRKAKAVAASYRAPEPEVNVSEGTPALSNDEHLVQRLVPVFERVLGEDKVTVSERSMGGEDFSRYALGGVPIFMYRLGSVEKSKLDDYRRKGQSPPSLHSSVYAPEPKPALKTGILTMVSAVLDLLPPREH